MCGVRGAHLAGKKDEGAAGAAQERFDILVVGYVKQVPIIKPCALEFFIINRKTHWVNKMQSSAGGCTGARYIAGVLWDLGVDKCDVKVWHDFLPFERVFRWGVGRGALFSIIALA